MFKDKLDLLNIVNYELKDKELDLFYSKNVLFFYAIYISTYKYDSFDCSKFYDLEYLIKTSNELEIKELKDLIYSIPIINGKISIEHFLYFSEYSIKTLNCDLVKSFKVKENLVKAIKFIKSKKIRFEKNCKYIFNVQGMEYFVFENGFYSFNNNVLWISNNFIIKSYNLDNSQYETTLVLGKEVEFFKTNIFFKDNIYLLNYLPIEVVQLIVNNEIDFFLDKNLNEQDKIEFVKNMY